MTQCSTFSYNFISFSIIQWKQWHISFYHLHGQAWGCWQSKYKTDFGWLIERSRKCINMYQYIDTYLCFSLLLTYEDMWALISNTVFGYWHHDFFSLRVNFINSAQMIMMSRNKDLRRGSFPSPCPELLVTTIASNHQSC